MKLRQNLNNSKKIKFRQLKKDGNYVIYNALADSIQLVMIKDDWVTYEYRCVASGRPVSNGFKNKYSFLSQWQVVIGKL